MKGYVTACGYMGYVENEYILFASEDDYFEYVDSLNFLLMSSVFTEAVHM